MTVPVALWRRVCLRLFQHYRSCRDRFTGQSKTGTAIHRGRWPAAEWFEEAIAASPPYFFCLHGANLGYLIRGSNVRKQARPPGDRSSPGRQTPTRVLSFFW